MRIEKQAVSVSWIPSESIPGLFRLPFDRRLMHYDPPPPLALTDLPGMRQRGELRFANVLRAYLDVSDGQITGAGYSGGLLPGLTPITAGPMRILLPAKPNRDIQWKPTVEGDRATFVQTAGCRPGFSLLRPTLRRPFLVTRPFTIWTTLQLTVGADGSATQQIVGASPFPRHWLYDNDGTLVEKTALTRNEVWLRTVFGSHTPWGGEDKAADVAQAETALERTLADTIMRVGTSATVRHLATGDLLFRQGEPGGSVALVLDGVLEVRVDDRAVGQVGPGTVVGERAPLETGRRTADLRALTDVRVAEVPEGTLDLEQLAQLALGHHHEDDR
jgi:hypothetical protein